MLSITDGASLARALDSSIDLRIKHLVQLRREQLGGEISGQAQLLVVERVDTRSTFSQAVGISPFQNPVDGSRFGQSDFTPAWEWIENHGFCFEVVFIFDDSGFAYVLIVPNEQGIDPQLLELCRFYASEHA